MALKVGTEDKKKVYMAAGLGAVMLILLVRFLWQNFGPSPAAPPAASPAVTEVRPAATTPRDNARHDCTGFGASGSEGRRLSCARSHAASGDHASGRVARVHRSWAQHLLPVLGGPGDTQTRRSYPPGACRYRTSAASAPAADQPGILWVCGGKDGSKASLPAAWR